MPLNYTREQLEQMSDDELESVVTTLEQQTQREADAKQGRRQVIEEDVAQFKRDQNFPSPGKVGLQFATGIPGGVGQAVEQVGTLISDPPSIIETPGQKLVKSLIPGLGSLQRGIGKRIREYGQSVSEDYQRARSGVGGGPIGEFAGTVGETLTSSLPTVAAAAATGGLAAPVIVAGSQSYAGTLNEGVKILQERMGIDRDEAVKRMQIPATAAGIITAGLTRYIPGGIERLSANLWKGVTEGTITKEGIKSISQNLLKESLLEMPEEALDEFSQGLILKASADPDKPIGDIAKEAMVAGLAAFFTTGISGGGQVGIKKTADYFASKDLSARAPDVDINNVAALVSPEIRSLIPTPTLDLIRESSGIDIDSIRTALETAQEEGQIRRVGDQVELLTDINRMPDAVQSALAPLLQGQANPAVTQILQGLPETTVEREEGATLPPSVPTETPNIGATSTENVMLIARNQKQRLEDIAKRGNLQPQQRVRLDILNSLIPNGGKTGVAPALARLFNLQVDEQVTDIPQAFSFITKPKVQESAPTTAESTPAPQATAPAPQQTQRQVARTDLTSQQARNYQGGPVVLVKELAEYGPMEVVDQTDPENYSVRALSDGTVMSVPAASVFPYAKGQLEPSTGRKVKRDEGRQEKSRQEVLTAEEAAKQTRQLETTPKTRPSESVIDTELRVEEPIQVNGIAYTPPVDSNDVKMANRIVAAISKLKAKFRTVPITQVQWVRTKGDNEPDIFTTPSDTGLETVSVDLVDLVFKLKDANDTAVERWLDAALEEEVIHMAGDMALQQEWVNDGGLERTGMTFDEYWEWRHEGMWEDMTDSQRAQVSEAYGISKDDHQAIAAEFARMVVQRQISGRTTEETLGGRILEYFQGMLRALQDLVNQVGSGVTQNRLLNHAIAIEQILKEQGQAQGQSDFQGNLRSRRLGTKIITAADLDSELVAEKSLPPEQVRFARQIAIGQNMATIGHVNQVWDTLSDETKGHLPFIQERVGVYRTTLTKTGIPEPTGSIDDFIKSSTQDPDQQATMYWSAWESMHDLLEQEVDLVRKVDESYQALEKATRSPDKKEVGNVVKEIASTHKDRLMLQRDLFRDNDQDTDPINAQIKAWDEVIRTGSTALERVVKAVLGGEAPSQIDFDQMKISEGMAAFIRPALSNFSDQGLVDISSKAISNELRAFQEASDALGFLQNTVKGDSRFRANYQRLVDVIKAEAVVDKDTDGTSLEFEHPYDPKVTFQIKRDADSRMDQQNQEILIELAGLMDKYVNDPDADPLRKAAYQRHLANIDNVMLNPALRTDAQHIMTSEFNIFKPLTGFGYWATPEYRLEGIGGRSAALAEQANFLYDQAMTVANRVAREKFPKLEQAAARAAKKHGMIARVYLETVSNAIIASRQEVGSVRIMPGTKYRGITITEQDMTAAKLMKDYVDTIYSELQNMETAQAKQAPLKTEDVNRTIPIRRQAQSAGEMIMPAKKSRKQGVYVTAWQSIIDSTKHEPKSERAKKRVRLIRTQILAGNDTGAFWDIVESHMRDAHTIPSYAKEVASPFKEDYQRMIKLIDEGTDQARPLGFESVVDFIFDGQAGKAPEDQMSKGQIAEQIILGEIGKRFQLVADDVKKESQESFARTNVDVTSSDNFLTRPRRGQLLPSSLTEYSVATMNQQAGVLRAVQQVYGQRLMRSLEGVQSEIQTELTRMEGEVSDSGRKFGKPGQRAAIQDIRRQQIDGKKLWNYDEAKYHLRQVGISMQYLEPLLNNKRDYFTEEFHVGARAVMRFGMTGILGSAQVIFRNRMGGTLMVMANEKSIYNSRKVMGYDMPFAATITQPTKRMVESGAQTLRWITGSGFLAHKFFKTEKGKEIVRNFEEHPELWSEFAGGSMELARREANHYEKLRQFGAAGHAPVSDSVRSLLMFWDQGGRLREGDPAISKKILGALESMLSWTHETGLLGILPVNLPRNAGAVTADMTNNVGAMRFADETVRRFQVNAIRAFQNRQNLGVMDRTEMFTPQELFSDRHATDKMAGILRGWFRKAGINIDAKMIEYARRIDKGADPKEASMISDAEFNSFQMVMMKAVNWGSFMNRPEYLTTTEMGRVLGALFGYPLWQNTRFALNSERMSHQGGVARAAGILRTAKWITMVVFAGIATAPIIAILRRLLYEEEQQVPRLSNVETPKEALHVAFSQAGPFMPTIGGILNYTTESVKPGLGVGGSGIQPIVLSALKDGMDTLNQISDTGDWMRPTMSYITQYMPNTKAYRNRLPMNEGLTTYYNLRRSIVAAVPENIEVQQFRPGSSPFRKGSTSDNKENVINALMRDGGPDWNTVLRERDLGVAQLREEKNPSPEQSFDSGVLARNSWRSALGRTPTAAERQRIMERMTEEQRGWAQQMEQVFTAYAQATGRTMNLVKDESTKQTTPVVPQFGGSSSSRRGLPLVPGGSQRRTFVR